jgi:hypothetical protein
MMNANNQPANPPAIVGCQQQQGHQRERSNTAHFTSTEVQGLLQVIEEILPDHGKEWEDVLQSHATSEFLKRKFQQLYRVKNQQEIHFVPLK